VRQNLFFGRGRSRRKKARRKLAGQTSSGVVSAAAVPSVCPTPRERRPGDSADAHLSPHEPAERGGLLLCHTLAQPLVGLAPVIATSATPVVEVMLDAAANPAVVAKHRAAVGGEPVRRPVGGRALTSAIRALLDLAGGSGIAAIRLDRMHGRRAARNAENAEGESPLAESPTPSASHRRTSAYHHVTAIGVVTPTSAARAYRGVVCRSAWQVGTRLVKLHREMRPNQRFEQSD
jgi:hypothetical protein